MKKALLLAVAALALALPAAGSAGPARAVSGSSSFADSTGELAGGPDITAVTVSNDDAGLLTFGISVPNRPGLTQDMAVVVALDTDQNGATGNANMDGADYVLDYEGGTASLGKWGGADWNWDVPQSSLVSSYSSGATLKVSAADLGNTAAFDFYVAVGQGDPSTGVVDFAPDAGHGTWAYRLQITPPAATPAPKAKPAPKKHARKKKHH